MFHVKFHSVKEVAESTHTTIDVVGAWIASGELVAVNVASSKDTKKPRWRISEIALAAFIERRSTQPASTPKKRHKKRPVESGAIQFV